MTIFASLSTTDPGDIEQTMEQLHAAGVRCNVVSICGHLEVLKRLASLTGGQCETPTDEEHLRRLIIVRARTKSRVEIRPRTRRPRRRHCDYAAPGRLPEVGTRYQGVGENA